MGDPGTKDELLSLADLEAHAGFRTGRKHVLSILTENKPGVLSRISGLFARRGFNIDTLTVGPTEDPARSRRDLGDARWRPASSAGRRARRLRKLYMRVRWKSRDRR